MQLRKITDDHYIVVSDEPIQEGDWVNTGDQIRYVTKLNNDRDQTFVDDGTMSNQKPSPRCYLENYKKVTHSTKPLEVWGLDKIYSKIKPIILSECRSLVGEVDVVELSKNVTKGRFFANGLHEELVAQIYYRKGYNQCLEDNKDKRFNLKEMFLAFEYGRTLEPFDSFNDFISSLTQPKDTWEVEFDENNNLKLK